MGIIKLSFFLILFSSCHTFTRKPLSVDAFPNDKSLIFFKTAAIEQSSESKVYVPLKIWVFELERNDLFRNWIKEMIYSIWDHALSPEELANLEEKLTWFMVDNQSKINLNLKINGHPQTLPPTGPDGLINANFDLPLDAQTRKQGYIEVNLSYQTTTLNEKVEILKEQSLSVISDIDDTIKLSEVLNKKKLLANTFLRPYQSIPHMSEVYVAWKSLGANFYYVSASPNALYTNLFNFLEKQKFPLGPLLLRKLRFKEAQSWTYLFKTSPDFKVSTISDIISHSPKQKFILVGDSGELDPETYAQIYTLYPNQIQRIFIRIIPDDVSKPDRFLNVFKNVPSRIWKTFQDPLQILNPASN